MRISAFSILDTYPEFGPGARDRYRELLDHVPELEASGFEALWVAEHHFQPGGVCPSPPVLLAAAGERSRRLRLGAMVSVLPFHSPIEVAEQYALLDRLLNGRLNLGVGSGYIPMEFDGFGVDPSEKRARFDRGLETVLAAFRGEEVRADGAMARPVRLNVRPLQSPHPPLWIAVQRREAIVHVARRGARLALVPYATVASLEELSEQIREYRAALPDGTPGWVSAALHVYAGPRPEVGLRAFQRFLDSRLATQSTFYQAKVRDHPEAGKAETLLGTGLAVVDRPQAAREKVERFARAGVDELLTILDFGGLPVEESLETIRSLGPSAERRDG